jgi:bifunctional UDP-N-acetylglucosamine pyrophosphorylase / glucosamine-1-phosphate N-acetyltransferase
MDAPPLSALVLAAAPGAAMRSERPKPIHLLCGRPLLRYVLQALADGGAHRAVVVTPPGADRIGKRILEDAPSLELQFIEQPSPRGSGDAALAGLTGFDDLDDEEDILLVPGDIPLLEAATIARLLEVHRTTGAACTVLAGEVDDPAGWDRVVRDRHQRVAGVAPAVGGVEGGGSGNEAPGRHEVALGLYVVRRSLLAPALRRLAPELVGVSAHRLSDLVGVLASAGHPVSAATIVGVDGVRAVDDRLQLAEAEHVLRQRTNRHWMSRGVTMVDPERTYIDATVELGRDVTLFPGTLLQGRTTIGDGCEIGPDTRLDGCVVGTSTVVEATMAHLARIGDHCRVGPFAVLEPGTEVPAGTTTGPFFAGRAEA